MNLKLQGLGAEPKKIGWLVGLVLLAGLIYFFTGRSGNSSSVTPAQPTTTAPAPNIQRPPVRPVSRTRPGQSDGPRTQLEYRPSLKPKDLDRANIDPRLHTDLLEKLRAVTAEGAGARSLFDFSAAPKAPAAPVKEPPKVPVEARFYGPKPPPPPPPLPQPPSAPPIPLKFYGFVNRARAGAKSAFFLDGDDIIVATEGDLIKKRYKIISIGLNSAVVEDTQFKSNGRQTLPLTEEQTG